MKTTLRKLRIPLFISVVTAVVGCYPEPVSLAEAQKYKSSSSKKGIVIGRVLAPRPSNFEAGRWLILQRLSEGTYPGRTLRVEIGEEGWFSVFLDPKTQETVLIIRFSALQLKKGTKKPGGARKAARSPTATGATRSN